MIQIATDGYSSSEACKACHPAHTAWRNSYHRTMTSRDAGKRGRGLRQRARDRRAEAVLLERRGRDLWADFDDLTDARATRRRASAAW
jgi:hypothetical protein